jgi:MFS family permease
VHGSSLGWLIAFVAVYGFGFGAVSPLQAAVMGGHFGRRAFGAIIALQGVPVALSAGAGPVLAGWLYDRFASYQIPFWLCFGAFVIAAVTVAQTPRPSAPS